MYSKHGQKAIGFISDRATYGWMSNFYHAPFRFAGLVWPTVEHAFQAAKNNGQQPWLSKIRKAKSPGDAKRIGQEIPLRRDWESVKVGIMTRLVTAKFETHEHLVRKLLSTGDVRIEEDAPWDSFWGTGRNGKGRNEMGKILMRLRSKLRKDVRWRGYIDNPM